MRQNVISVTVNFEMTKCGTTVTILESTEVLLTPSLTLLSRLQSSSLVFFYNLSRYDASLFIKNLGVVEGKIDCFPKKNEENYISFSKEIVIGKYIDGKGNEKDSKREIRFLDSFRFMQYSLAKLVSPLSRATFNNLSTSYYGELFDLLVKKGVFPYAGSTALRNSMQQNYHLRKIFTQNLQTNTFQTMTMLTHGKFGRHST